MHRSCTLICATACVLAAAAPAYADRDGDGAVRAPISKKLHTEFVLPGEGWAQVRSRDSEPIVGVYATDAVPTEGASCKLQIAVDSKAQGVYPVVGKRAVRMHPMTRVALRYSHTGRHDGVRWWYGTQLGQSAAVAVQRMPKAMRSKHRQWIVTLASAGPVAAPADEQACRSHVREHTKRTLLRVAHTLRLADGPSVFEAPFVTL